MNYIICSFKNSFSEVASSSRMHLLVVEHPKIILFHILFNFLSSIHQLLEISDNVREKQSKKRKCYGADSFFDDATSSDALNAETAISFDQMNLSRALLKVTGRFPQFELNLNIVFFRFSFFLLF